MDGDGEDDEAVPMVVFDLYGKLSIDDGNDGRGARVRSSGRKMRERERGQVRMGSRGAVGEVLYLTPRRGQTRGGGSGAVRGGNEEHGGMEGTVAMPHCGYRRKAKTLLQIAPWTSLFYFQLGPSLFLLLPF